MASLASSCNLMAFLSTWAAFEGSPVNCRHCFASTAKPLAVCSAPAAACDHRLEVQGPLRLSSTMRYIYICMYVFFLIYMFIYIYLYTSHAQFLELEARPFSEHRRSQVEPVWRTG